MSKEYTRAGRKFCIEAFPKPTILGVTTFTQKEYDFIKDSKFTDQHFQFLCDQKGINHRYEFIPENMPEAQKMAIDKSEEILKALRGDKDIKRILDF